MYGHTPSLGYLYTVRSLLGYDEFKVQDTKIIPSLMVTNVDGLVVFLYLYEHSSLTVSRNVVCMLLGVRCISARIHIYTNLYTKASTYPILPMQILSTYTFLPL